MHQKQISATDIISLAP